MFADAFDDESFSPPVQKKRTEAGFFNKMKSIIAPPKKGSNEDIVIDDHSEDLSAESNSNATNFKTMKSTRSTRSKGGNMLNLPKPLKSSKKRRKKSVLGIPRDKQYNYALT
mmetsp:Transcript_24673/g.38376  ORF Transcript_24673/g.38376 Transcript_24673/m.38376 type:complete len:112 (+) Transcript_24673:387-722(+)